MPIITKFIGIVGSRPPKNNDNRNLEIWNNLQIHLANWLKENLKQDHCLVSGMAAGVDSLGETFARENRIAYLIFPPKELSWTWFHARNKQIVDNSNIVYGWTTPWSRGTDDTLKMAKESGKLGKRFEVSDYENSSKI